MKHIFVISAVALCVGGLSRPAQAQIYSWRDANGIMVLSNVPRNGAPPAAASYQAVTAHVAPPQFTPQLLMSVGANYDRLIHEHSTLQGVRAELVRAVIQVESAFNPRAISPKGAMGLMQLMPSTAARFGVLDPFNPAENIRAGVSYLKQLLLRYDHNEELALAAYNAGPKAVDRNGTQIPPYVETQKYVKRVNALRGNTPGAPGARIYKQVEIVDGRPVFRYSNTKPASGDYQEVGR